ncbi:6 TM domain-containing transmembrane protein [Acrasis kona]|uniref:6 TM domain-containing transmembrane protein n=1 Tax=Acrasis kona TaxID=1008807 RepID=A0AAW2YNT9_9EUKA
MPYLTTLRFNSHLANIVGSGLFIAACELTFPRYDNKIRPIVAFILYTIGSVGYILSSLLGLTHEKRKQKTSLGTVLFLVASTMFLLGSLLCFSSEAINLKLPQMFWMVGSAIYLFGSVHTTYRHRKEFSASYPLYMSGNISLVFSGALFCCGGASFMITGRQYSNTGSVLWIVGCVFASISSILFGIGDILLILKQDQKDKLPLINNDLSPPRKSRSEVHTSDEATN